MLIPNLKSLAESKGAGAEFEALAAKCGADLMYYRPYGGAMSFEDIDEMERATEIRMEANELTDQMRFIIANIMDSDELAPADRKDRIVAAAEEFANRAGELPEITGKELDDGEQKGLGRAMRLVRGIFNGKKAVVPTQTDALVDFLTNEHKDLDGSFVVQKDLDGNYRWLAVYSNRYKDREDEVFPESDHKEFMQWLDATKAYPELWLWHTPGSRIGQADWADYSSEGFALASGGFDDGMEDVADALAADKDLAVSHGFRFRNKVAGAIKGYRSFEISPLPRGREANTGTSFSAAIKEATMLTPTKRAFLESKMGPERVKQVEAALTVMQNEMSAKGIEFKDIVEEFATNGSPAAEAAKSVPPGPSPSADAPGNQPATPPALTLDAIKAAMKETTDAAVAPLAARLEGLETAQKALDPRWRPAADPSVAAKSADAQDPTGTKDEGKWFDPNDPIASIANKALDDVSAANKEIAADPMPIGIDPIKTQFGMMFGQPPSGAPAVAPSANGVPAGA